MTTTTETPLRPVKVSLICDCGTEMRSDGVSLATMPPQALHTCPDCGTKTIVRGDAYPRIEWRDG